VAANVSLHRPCIPSQYRLKRLKEFIAFAKANLASLSYGARRRRLRSSNLTGELFKFRWRERPRIVQVPYRGTGPADHGWSWPDKFQMGNGRA